MRFIGRKDADIDNMVFARDFFRKLDDLDEFKSDFNYDILFIHHYGLCVDVGPWHGFWGRFMRAGSPVPEEFLYFDLVPHNDGKAGPPFCSQLAYVTFSGDMDAMHKDMTSMPSMMSPETLCLGKA